MERKLASLIILSCILLAKVVNAQEQSEAALEENVTDGVTSTFIRDEFELDVTLLGDPGDEASEVVTNVIETTTIATTEDTTLLTNEDEHIDDIQQVPAHADETSTELLNTESTPPEINEVTTVSDATTNTNDKEITMNTATEISPHTTEMMETTTAPTSTVPATAQAPTFNPPAPSTSTEQPAVSCNVIGDFAHESDCHAYYTCLPTIAGLHLQLKSCPIRHAFDPSRGHCTRDLSPCADGFQCFLEGAFSDPVNNSSYYLCVPQLGMNVGFHVYRVQCGIGQIFMPQLGKCFIDMDNLQDLPLNYELYMVKSADEEIIKGEVRAVKAAEKARLKEEKLKEKVQKKFEKELLKKSAKEAKEQAKLGDSEVNSFSCTQEGYFGSPESIADYYACVGKKGNFKVVSMKCPSTQYFDAQWSACV